MIVFLIAAYSRYSIQAFDVCLIMLYLIVLPYSTVLNKYLVNLLAKCHNICSY